MPLEVIHSASIEMLIQQNEDLSARLKVNIRRNSMQEQEIFNLENSIQKLRRKAEALKAQKEITDEKQKIWSSQKEASARKTRVLH